MSKHLTKVLLMPVILLALVIANNLIKSSANMSSAAQTANDVIVINSLLEVVHKLQLNSTARF
ncbi:hypothetical protein PTD2_21072 [Pseudoalteromonas tunicata D2]|uniref:Uncharacterized protein n=1 Tax=Pseudoalteromonas tunicata D2 TaxID=87626 RepID=A4CAE0_9GAMM|nr:hypothetical protein PTD2_21072 [Pseudoalteromonas tunicata D2]